MNWFSFFTWLGLAAILIVGCSVPEGSPLASFNEIDFEASVDPITSASGVAIDSSQHRVATFRMW